MSFNDPWGTDGDPLPVWRDAELTFEVLSTDPWWRVIVDKFFPDGVRRSNDPIPEIEMKVEVEGIQKTFRLSHNIISAIEYRHNKTSFKLEFSEQRIVG